MDPETASLTTRPKLQIPPNSDLTLGMVCVTKKEPGVTRWEMRVDERFLNPGNICQGGFLSAFADSSMGAAAITSVQTRKVSLVNAEMKISFLYPAKIDQLLSCAAKVIRGGKSVIFVEASIVEIDSGELIARATSTYVVKDRP